jgi:4'-phosphopantetheinyl transferase
MDDENMIWSVPPSKMSIDCGEVHVWAVSLQFSNDSLNRLTEILAPAERLRARTFHFDVDRNRYIVGRAAMRTILARYLCVQPERVRLDYGFHGKPQLAGFFAETGLQFNLAHCENLAVMALGHRAVGIDVERIREIDGNVAVASTFCSPNELKEFQQLPCARRDAAFFRLWTRKEAWLKATGSGIGHSLQNVEVSFLPGDSPRFIRLPQEAGELATAWSLRELIPAFGFLAALAVPGEISRVDCWTHVEDEKLAYA